MRGWRWLAPAVVVLLAVSAWPIGRGVWNSLSSYSLSSPDDRTFVGADNYVEVLTSRTWWLAVAVTIVIVIASVAVQLSLGLLFAGALHRLAVAWPVTRVLVLVPFAVLAVVSAVVWRDAATTGFASAWFRLGQVTATGSLVAVTIGEIWRGTAIVTVILLAGLRRAPATLLAAAAADGATGWQRFRRVVLPIMGPAFAVAVTYRALDTFRILEGPLLVDEPTATVRTAPLLVWTTNFSSFELGLGAAMSMILLLLAGLLGILLVLLVRVGRVV